MFWLFRGHLASIFFFYVSKVSFNLFDDSMFVNCIFFLCRFFLFIFRCSLDSLIIFVHWSVFVYAYRFIFKIKRTNYNVMAYLFFGILPVLFYLLLDEYAFRNDCLIAALQLCSCRMKCDFFYIHIVFYFSFAIMRA